MEEMHITDFSLGSDYRRANRLISTVFGTRSAYVKGDMTAASKVAINSWDFLPKAYLDLISSPGRNEPDDRICSVEFIFSADVPLSGVKAMIVPHTLWDVDSKAPWLHELQVIGVQISPYQFIPGRSPEYYHSLLECEVEELYRTWGIV
jgi:hypothetical protein